MEESAKAMDVWYPYTNFFPRIHMLVGVLHLQTILRGGGAIACCLICIVFGEKVLTCPIEERGYRGGWGKDVAAAPTDP
jgi:hypothetical protein